MREPWSGERAKSAERTTLDERAIERDSFTACTRGAQVSEAYGFVQSPFTLAPDPRFLYLSQSHDAALQLLLQAIERKEGIVVLTGDIGTGKTTVCRSVLERLDMTCFTSLLLNPFLSVEELLREILLDFGIERGGAQRPHRRGHQTPHGQHPARVPDVADTHRRRRAC